MKTILIPALGLLALASTSHAQLGGVRGGIMLGGGYLEEPDKAYLFGQLRGTVYEDDAVAHTFFFEAMGHWDDAVIEFAQPGGGSFLEDGDLSFYNFTLNYELEAKLGGPVSFFIGGGAGVEYVSIDDRFDVSLDSDTNFVAQFFAGFRVRSHSGFTAQLGARFIMRDDFRILGDQFVAEDTWAYEASFGLQF